MNWWFLFAMLVGFAMGWLCCLLAIGPIMEWVEARERDANYRRKH